MSTSTPEPTRGERVTAPYRIATDARPDWKIRARTHGPGGPRTLTTQIQTGTAPLLDLAEMHRRGALALARKIDPAAEVSLHSRGPHGDAFDWTITLPLPAPEPTPYDPHTRDGERFRPDPRHALRLAIVIDNNEREEYPDHPYTLNAWLTDPVSTQAGPDLLVRGETCLVDGTVSQQLRYLADAIEDGAVFL